MDYFDLNMGLSEEDIALKTNANKFAREVMRPISIELDKMSPEEVIAPESPFWNYMSQAYQLGYHKLAYPEVLGGPGLSLFQVALVMEELAWGSVGMTLALNTSFEAAMAAEMSEEEINNFTIPYTSCTDGSYIGAWACAEPDHGTDTGALFLPSFHDPKIGANCRARLDGDEWVIHGQKAAWVSNGTLCKTVFLICQVEPSMGHAGSGMFIFSLDRPGVSKGKPWNKLGMRELNQGEIFFDQVRVPKKAMVVGPEHYEAAFAAHLSMTMAMVGVWFTGLARAGFEEALAYAREKVQGGKKLVEHGSIQQKLFDMFRKVEASRQLSRAAFLYNWSNPPEKRVLEYSMAAKTFATQAALEVTSDAVKIFGANGLSKEYIIEKLYRDAQMGPTADGANDSISMTGGNLVAITYPRNFK